MAEGYLAAMRMDTVNISLTQAQAEYVRQTVRRDFGNVSEFFRDLLRQKMEAEIGADLQFLQSTAKDAPAGPSEAQIQRVLEIQREVRKQLKHEGRI
jgi:Arc/MetJ-type ribon-helix-helix transcriptional regulator